VIKEGEGEVVAPNSIVSFHYNGYREYEDEPYDSTHLRRNPMIVRLGQGGCLPGLEMGVETMKKGEICQLLVHPDLAFGKFGCPPRIPPSKQLSNILIIHSCSYNF
jgi:FKBP-type peptidyl-prolyl cis-trans isomerase